MPDYFTIHLDIVGNYLGKLYTGGIVYCQKNYSLTCTACKKRNSIEYQLRNEGE